MKIRAKEIYLRSVHKKKQWSAEVRLGREEKEREEDQVLQTVSWFSLARDSAGHSSESALSERGSWGIYTPTPSIKG